MKIQKYFTVVTVLFSITMTSVVANNVDQLANFTNEGTPIQSGYVFLDGTYIDMPYIVSQRGLHLYVNDIQIPNVTRIPGRRQFDLSFTGLDVSAMTNNKKEIRYKIIQDAKRIYEYNLKEGYAYLLFSNGGHMLINPYDAAYTLPSIINTLKSNYMSRNEKIEELKHYGWNIHNPRYLERLVDNFYSDETLDKRIEDKANEYLNLDIYGESTETVEEGLVFINGCYLEAPYTIVRKGLGVFINDQMIERPEKWPIEIVSGDINPAVPPEIHKYTSFYDDVVKKYLWYKGAYLAKSYSPEEEARIMEETIKRLPFVVDAELDPKDSTLLHFVTTEDDRISQRLTFIRREPPSQDIENVRNRVKEKHKYYKRALDRGNCFLISDKGAKIRLSKDTVHQSMPELIDIIGSNEDRSIKLNKIEKLKIDLPESIVEELLLNYKPSMELKKRLED